MKFKNDIEVQAGIKDSSGSDGALGQVLSSTVSGVSWINPPVTGVTGSGTVNFVPKWSSSTALTNSRIIDNGVGVFIGYGGVGAGAAWALSVTNNGTSQGGLAVTNAINNFPLFRLENLGTGEFIQARSISTQSDVFSVNYLGDTTANSFIKIGGTSSQYLMADGSVSTGPSVSGYVPYTGANQDVDLGANQLKADSLAVSTTSVEPVNVGEIVWNAIDGTFDMGLIGGVTLQAGQEMHVYGKATQAIANGDAVMFAGVQGDHILIAKADPVVINANPEYFIGISTQALATNDFGYITVFGNVRELNTTAYTLGSVLYYDSVTSLLGLLTPTEPVAPYAKIEVAAVVRVHATQGILLVRPHVMPKLSDIQDVYAPNPFNNDVLFWNSSNSRYETNTIPGILGYNPERQLTFTSPLSRVSNTISIPQSTSTVDGYLSSTDWTTFNSKQGELNGTGFVKVSGTTVTYDNSVYALDSDVVKLTGNQSITGTKTFNVSTINDAILVNNTGGRGIRIINTSSGFGLIVNNESASTAIPFVVQKSGATVLSINDSGAINASSSITGNSFIKSGGTSAQILAADGSVITAGTGISISGGTISSTVVGGVTSFNTRTGAVTLTSTDVNTALGYTAANDANVVKLTGDQGILGIKSFNHINGSVENFTTRLNYFFDNGIIRSDVTPLETINNLTSQSIFKVDKDGNTTANSFIKIGGNSTQYLKADGSVSTAMNSRVEVNFTATSGQTTFTTPYEVGQIDVYYNGSKLNPSEFTATNGTTVVLAQAATLNAQISIVKYVAALSTTAIRNETTFTATSGQTTFSVNYTVGQLDVFYNGSKLNVSEFTATNGTSVVLGFACQAGESVVFVSYVNQVSGASGTANRVAKFTGAATLGDSQIFDNGNNVGIGVNNPTSAKLQVSGNNGSAIAYLYNNTGTTGQVFGLAIEAGTNSNDYALSVGSSLGTSYLRVNGIGNLGLGTVNPSSKIEVSNGDIKITDTYAFGWRYDAGDSNMYNRITNSYSSGIRYQSGMWTGGNILAHDLQTWNGSSYVSRLAVMQSGNVLIGNTVDNTALARSIILNNISNCGIVFQNAASNKGYLYNFASDLYLETTGGVIYVMAGTNGVRLNAGATSWTSNSDSRLKNINYTIENAVDKLCALNPVSFSWKSDESNKEVLGLIAQDVEKVFPQIIDKNKLSRSLGDESEIDETEYLGVRYQELIPVLVKAIQEQQAQIKELQDEIISLKNK